VTNDAISEAKLLPNATIDESDPSAVRIEWWVDPSMRYVAQAPSLARAAEIALDQAHRTSKSSSARRGFWRRRRPRL
jgi:hypothetical protein